MSTPRKATTPRKAATPSRIPRPSRGTTPSKATPRRAALTPSKGLTPRGTPAESSLPIVSKNPENDQGEEGIIVAIRMRPLNAKESTDESASSSVSNRVWRVLPQYNSITQTTASGQPLPERVTGRTFFAFDKTFGEQTTTREVYNGVAKGIVSSVVSGLNGTIFAYGQTSSGKTHTMQGSGSIEEGLNGGGVVHMAACDIFDHIDNTPDRLFLVRASFIEIYNEEVRDLLGNNQTLQIREDPRRGVFVSSVEEIVTDYTSLLETLFDGEKNRAVAATGMNERSSRSHTIFRITIESHLKSAEGDDSKENFNEEEDDDGAVRVSTLNLVDLAGSESVRHTGSTGDRQKEGGKINQSLLTLSRVIVGLGQSGKAHINFRDSKLTRILQPSLSGNARMAVVCCATPSELYLEETRSTLMFASRAKLVKTHATVNEVLDDRSLIKKLQRELAEARRHSSDSGNQEHLIALKAQAAKSGTAAREAEEKLRKLKASILNTGVLLSKAVAPQKMGTKKRRLSDAQLYLKTELLTPTKNISQTAVTPKTVPQGEKERQPKGMDYLSPGSELSLVRHAVTAKAAQNSKLQSRLEHANSALRDTGAQLETVISEKNELLRVCESAKNESRALTSDLDEVYTEYQIFRSTAESSIVDKDQKIAEDQEQMKTHEAEKAILHQRIAELECVVTTSESNIVKLSDQVTQLERSLGETNEQAQATIAALTEDNQTLEHSVSAKLAEKEERIADLTRTKTQLERLLAESKEQAVAKITKLTEEHENVKKSAAGAFAEAESTIAELANAKTQLELQLAETTKQADFKILELTQANEQLRKDGTTKLAEAEILIVESTQEKTQLELLVAEIRAQAEATITELTLENEQLESTSSEAYEEAERTIAELTQAKIQLEQLFAETKAQAEAAITELTAENETLEATSAETYAETEIAFAALAASKELLELESDRAKVKADSTIVELTEQKAGLQRIIESLRSEMVAMGDGHAMETETLTNTIVQLEEKIFQVEQTTTEIQYKADNVFAEKTEEIANLQDSLKAALLANNTLTEKQVTFSTEFTARMVELEKDLSEAHGREQILSEERLRLSFELARGNSARESAASESAEAKHKIQEMGGQISLLMATMQDASQEKMALAEKNASLLLRLSDMASTKECAEKEIDKLRAELTRLAAELESVQDHRASLESAHSELIQKHAEAIAQFSATAKAKDDELEALHRQLQQQLSEFESHRAEFESEMEAVCTELCDARAKKGSISEEKERVCEQHRKRVVELEEKQGEVDALQVRITSLEGSIKIAEAENVKHETLLSQLESDLENALSELGALKARNDELNESEATLYCELDKLREALKTAEEQKFTLSENLVNRDTDISTLTAELEIAKAELESAEATLEDAVKQIEDLEGSLSESRASIADYEVQFATLSAERSLDFAMIEDLQAALVQDKDRAAVIDVQLECIQEEARALRTVITEKENTIEMLLRERDSATASLKISAQSLVEAKQHAERLEAAVSDLNAESTGELTKLLEERQAVCEQYDDQCEVLASVTKDCDELKSTIESYEASLADAKTLAQVVRAERDVLLSQSSDWARTIDQLKQDAANSAGKVKELDHIKSSMEAQMEESRNLLETARSELLDVRIELKAGAEENASLKSELLDTSTSRETLAQQFGTAIRKVEFLESSIAELKTSSDGHSSGLIDEKEKLSSMIACQTEDIVTLTEELINLRSQLSEKSARLEDAEAHIKELEMLVSVAREAAEYHTSVMEEATCKSQAEIERVSAQMRIQEADLSRAKEERGVALTLLESSKVSVELLQTTIADLRSQSNDAITRISVLATERDHALSQFELLRSATADIETLLANSQSSIETLQAEKAMIVEHSQSQHSISSQFDSSQATVASLRGEVEELTQLLSSANQSVTDAREAAEAAEDDLQLLEHRHEETLQHLSQKEEDLCSCNARIDELESQVRGLTNRESYDDLLAEMEQLMDEKLKAEGQLEQERSATEETVVELKRLMGEEQRMLVQEAEATMALLRTDNDQLKSALALVEAETYSVKQEIEELQDQNKRLEQKSMEAEASTSYLRNDLANYDAKMAAISSENRKLTKEIKVTKARMESQQERSSVEVIQAVAELNSMKAECYAAKQQVLDMEEALSEHCDEKETLAKALRELRERATHLESQLPDLEQANKQLSVQIKNLLTNEELALANKENNSSHFEVEKLRKKIDELTKEIASKDLRIKKLDSVKLTKEQCNALKKMKIEREEFQQEAKDYRSKLRQAEKEIAMLKATSNVATAGGFNGDEVASLTFAKDALETKLRKYAAHCQRLESDKATIVDALKSCDRHAIVDGDLAGAIVTLCDQLSSLEEECDALSSAEGRASSYLMEMEKIRDQVAGLQKELSVAQEKISTLARSEADLVINLKDAKEKLSSLRSERDQFKGIVESEKGFAANKETEKSRQIKFLEQENLQLMLDLKTTKKQLQGSRAELDNTRMRALDDTEDLNDFALHASAKSITLSSGSIGSITSSDPLTPDKENIPNFVRRDGSKRKSIAGSVKKMLGTRSARKKARTNPPGLGEPGRDEDNTENCQQS